MSWVSHPHVGSGAGRYMGGAQTDCVFTRGALMPMHVVCTLNLGQPVSGVKLSYTHCWLVYVHHVILLLAELET
jgi:hypothetical protein